MDEWGTYHDGLRSLASAIIVVSMLPGLSAATSTAPEPTSSAAGITIEVVLDETMTTGTAWAVVQNRVSTAQLVADQVTPSGMNYTSGYVVPDGAVSGADLESAYRNAVVASKRDLLRLIDEEIVGESTSLTEKAALNVERRDQRSLLTAFTSMSESAPVTRILATVTPEHALESVKDADSVGSVSHIPEPAGASPPGTAMAAAECLDSSVWWATKGYIKSASSSTTGQRFVQQRFLWTQGAYDNLLSCDGARTSYEPDAFYNNNDGSIYLGEAIAWEASFSGAYLDSQFLDGGAEKQYTVGAGRVNQLSPDVNYRTYIRAAAGDAARDSAKAQGQRGRNDCPGDTVNAFCVLDSSDTESLVPAWRHPAPGSTTWGGYVLAETSTYADDNDDVSDSSGGSGLSTPDVDIREHGARNTSTTITLQLRTDAPSATLLSEPNFFIDLVGGVSAHDFVVADLTDGNGVDFRVLDNRSGVSNYLCDATATYASPYYKVSFPSSCIGSPRRIFIRSTMVLFAPGSGVARIDAVPNAANTWDGPIAR